MPGLDASTKLGGYDFFHKVLGSPKYVVAPMVDQSELAWRRLSRKYGAQLFAEGVRKSYRNQMFNIPIGEEGGPGDRPLIVQFCANDPDALLAAAKIVEPHCDAVDINLGCPQDIARKGHYGSFLQDEWELIYKLINILHVNLNIPVTAKFRVFPTVEKTVEYAKMLERAGAQILTCHGRTREQRGQRSGLADWEKIRAVKEAVSVPVIANGNILFNADIERCLAATGADAVMSAEGNLYNPAIFLSTSTPTERYIANPLMAFQHGTGMHLSNTQLALEYLEIVDELATPTSPSAVKGHLFKLLLPALSRETDLRERLGKVKFTTKGKDKERIAFAEYAGIVRELDERLRKQAAEAEGKPREELITIESTSGLPILPQWLAQPYIRPGQATLDTQQAEPAEAKKLAADPPTNANPKSQVEPIVIDVADLETAPTEANVNATATAKRTYSESTAEHAGDELTKRIKLTAESEVLVN
ncbi:hypothetical protein EIP86_004684 [Pleurotus ostreatoroseus]|nr:hypothetical protein EIP86_004684 [Pleurotus ostreatoroseus]